MTIAQVWYFAFVDVVILLSLGVAFGLVVMKSMTDPGFTLEAHGNTLLLFGSSLLVYLVLRTLEARTETNREIRKFVAHFSHLAGVLAALFLIFLLSPITAACLAPFWCVWLCAVVSIAFAKLRNRNPVANLPV